ncbi:MAG TPA: PRC-barrel domain containing protein [Rhodopirellula baltica]|uniref:PRC-barrel domain-containing protein n=1 Tax=Rhodopirellula baltica (strain DSM 10527 / NCIMB 13988 / SH1) TaxID=243090 RepID=Q7UIV7_RHOBA|nr:PRC-barrel domain-containing protein [Rhodopirellula baltica]CAD77505.1 conserved hypothetical protein [Rhodopirellula baltica SH 1]HBE64593.1 PRC-barrel domain containing protein [Rhodopirellula baltica]
MVRTIQTSFLVALTACLSLPLVSAQTTSEQFDTRSRQADASRLDAKMSHSNVRVSQLMGLNLQNSQGESVGEIKDIVLNAKTGKVRYAVVTYGGFLGMGNKLFAVPFEALKTQVDPDEVGDDDIDEDDYVMVLDVTQEQLEGQEGFDEDNWPNMADKQWAADLDKRYNVERRNANRLRRNNDQ